MVEITVPVQPTSTIFNVRGRQKSTTSNLRNPPAVAFIGVGGRLDSTSAGMDSK